MTPLAIPRGAAGVHKWRKKLPMMGWSACLLMKGSDMLKRGHAEMLKDATACDDMFWSALALRMPRAVLVVPGMLRCLLGL